jgi:hypothetical protein
MDAAAGRKKNKPRPAIIGYGKLLILRRFCH